MKRRLIKLLLIIALVIFLLVIASIGDGYVLIAYGNKTIEMTLMVALLILFTLLFLLWCLRVFLRGGVSIVRGFRRLFRMNDQSTSSASRHT